MRRKRTRDEVSITIPVLTKERMRLRVGRDVFETHNYQWWTVAAIEDDGVILRRDAMDDEDPTVVTRHCDWDFVRLHVRPDNADKYSV